MEFKYPDFKIIHSDSIDAIVNHEWLFVIRPKVYYWLYDTAPSGLTPIMIRWKYSIDIDGETKYSLIGEATCALIFTKGEYPYIGLRQFILNTFEPMSDHFTNKISGTKLDGKKIECITEEEIDAMVLQIIAWAQKESLL